MNLNKNNAKMKRIIKLIGTQLYMVMKMKSIMRLSKRQWSRLNEKRLFTNK
jgi:hypothetical protein